MPGEMEHGTVRFALHGPEIYRDTDEVEATVFANKLALLVLALKTADEAVNERHAHIYTIKKLKSSVPTVLIKERPNPKHEPTLMGARSGIRGFQTCLNAVRQGDTERAQNFGNTAKHIWRLATVSRTKFTYAEVEPEKGETFRIDDLLSEQATTIISPRDDRRLDDATVYFKGIAHGAFDGIVKGVDLRGKLPSVKLVLSVGDKSIDCICPERYVSIDMIRSALDRRVRAVGDAYYDGRSKLPRRLEVNRFDSLEGESDLMRWKGAFEPFVPSELEETNE